MSRGALAAYVAVLLTLTHWPRIIPPLELRFDYVDKVVHFSLYAVLAGLLVAVLQSSSRTSDWTLARRVRLAALTAIAFGLFDEVTQPLTQRDFDWLDWAADVAGAVSGACAAGWWIAWRSVASDHDPAPQAADASPAFRVATEPPLSPAAEPALAEITPVEAAVR